MEKTESPTALSPTLLAAILILLFSRASRDKASPASPLKELRRSKRLWEDRRLRVGSRFIRGSFTTPASPPAALSAEFFLRGQVSSGPQQLRWKSMSKKKRCKTLNR